MNIAYYPSSHLGSLLAQFPDIWDAAQRENYASGRQFVRDKKYNLDGNPETRAAIAHLFAFSGYLVCIVDEIEKAGAPPEMESLYHCARDHLGPCTKELLRLLSEFKQK